MNNCKNYDHNIYKIILKIINDDNKCSDRSMEV